MSEVMTNGLVVTLSNGGSPVSSSVTSITVAYLSGGTGSIPSVSSQTMRCFWDGEIITVTATSGGGNVTWTIVRGAESTTAVSHADQSVIYQIASIAGMQQYIADQIINNLAAGKGIGLTTSSNTVTITVTPLTPPVSANWTNFNTSGMGQAPTFANSRFTMASGTQSGTHISGLTIAVPTAPYTRTFRVWSFFTTAASVFPGSMVGWTDGTKFSVLVSFMDAVGPLIMGTGHYATTTSSSSGAIPLVAPFSSLTSPTFPVGVPAWIQLNDDNTNWNISVSFDGANFIQVAQEASNSYLTATNLFVGTTPNSGAAAIVFDSYQ